MHGLNKYDLLSIFYTYSEYFHPQRSHNEVLNIYRDPHTQGRTKPIHFSQVQHFPPTSPFELWDITRRARSGMARLNPRVSEYTIRRSVQKAGSVIVTPRWGHKYEMNIDQIAEWSSFRIVTWLREFLRWSWSRSLHCHPTHATLQIQAIGSSYYIFMNRLSRWISWWFNTRNKALVESRVLLR